MTKRQTLAIVLISAGIVIILFSGLGAARAFRHMEGHGPFGEKPPAANQTDVSAIRDWMTIAYVAHMYDVPSDAIFQNLEINKNDKTKKMSLAQLNEEFYPDQPGIVLERHSGQPAIAPGARRRGVFGPWGWAPQSAAGAGGGARSIDGGSARLS